MRFILFILYQYLKHSKHTFHYLYTKSMYVQIIIEKIQSTFNINMDKTSISIIYEPKTKSSDKDLMQIFWYLNTRFKFQTDFIFILNYKPFWNIFVTNKFITFSFYNIYYCIVVKFNNNILAHYNFKLGLKR